MKELIEDFTKHLQHSIELNKNTTLTASNKVFDNVLICGLGGSGIGATIIVQVVADNAKLPILVNKDYKIPQFVNEKTLVIACSYSGNTEETLEMITQAEQKNATIACVTSGGKLAALAIEKKYNHILIPGGHPPRAAFGLAFPSLFKLLNYYGIINYDYSNEFNKAIELINENESLILVEAGAITEKLYKKIPVIYAESSYEGVAVRFRQQINENSKMLCWHHVIPEMNHNELVGWANKNEDLAVVIFRNEDDYYRNKKRIEVNKTVFEKYTSTVIEIHSKGNSKLERALYLIHLGDWISYLLAEKNGVDVVEVDVITHLKNELSKI
ncbi:MAG: bifunctional phosphoglucose/phosphomannose isomerase [Flavobacteriales bacterium]|nr:bifunctional phosphoglucose/phosphomannose isomerase [Flavobacteriales bacterium]MCW8914002.1 bifunctional phosphoglucose/phosphomannose isomerase [Flavobacteriales bacterium]MCW8937741.1 bifunctional phosphoglucose/phosphomannose isomerase [Flavobacteriales bacterium]MCW8940500.1 bifunctional phosphoglucose/phosphomannose isomerase [Flavobacteriales bacterium]MCW8967922.1 bifunctional phosphoglucose/phosphomannose isomerase [Flavobacteriales bacterium]